MLRAAALCSVCLPGLAIGATLHVATTGKDANPGTVQKPFKTIQAAVNAAKAGDTVLVHTGRYVGRVSLRKALILKAAPNEKPIIDGTGIAVPDDGSGLVAIEDASRVTLQGFEIRNYRTTNSFRCPMGVYIRGKCDAVTVRGNTVHHIENTGANAGEINAFGIAAYGDSKQGAITNLVIDGNEVRDTKTGNSETLTVNGNVDGFAVTDNWVHDADNIGIVCIGYERTSPLAGKDFARNGLIAGNLVEDVSSYKNPAYHRERSAGGIYVDGGADIVIERNVVRRADLGMEITSEHQGREATGVIVRNNLITASGIVGLSIGGYARNKGGTRNCTFVNNTLVGNDTTESGTGEFQVQFNTAGNLLANNILVASAQGVLISSLTGANSDVGMKTDFNLYFAPGKPVWRWNGETYRTLNDFSRGTGNDAHSDYAMPKFVDTAKGDYRLRAGSSGLNGGKDYGVAVVGEEDLAGNVRVRGSGIDMGCYERLGG